MPYERLRVASGTPAKTLARRPQKADSGQWPFYGIKRSLLFLFQLLNSFNRFRCLCHKNRF